MPRRARVEVDGGVYHVYNRVASGERVFAEADVAIDFIERIRAIKERDGWTVFAWCVMANHYHLVIRRSTVDVASGLHWLQGRFSRSFNRRWRRSGSLWQSRYHAKHIDEQRYLSQAILYVHLNPVRAGVVDEPADYPFSGHREIVRRVRRPLVDVDHALLSFDERRSWARRAYMAGIQAGAAADHMGVEALEGGGSPSWQEAVPWEEEVLAPSPGAAARHRLDLIDARPSAGDLVAAACEEISVPPEELNGRRRTRELAAARRMVTAVLLEEWGVPRRELATALGRNPEVLSHWLTEIRATRGRDADLARGIRELDQALQTRFIRAEGS